MKYIHLKDLLRKNGIETVNISSLHLLKVGCTTYSAKPDNWIIEEQEESTDTDTKVKGKLKKPVVEDWEFFSPSTFSTIAEALKKHPNVFDLHLEVSDSTSSHGGSEHTFISGGLIKVRLEIPKRFQKYADGLSTPIERFEVISLGSAFGAFATVNDINESAYIAHEYREIVQKQINTETDFWSNVLGPCPIHPDIYIVRLTKDALIEPKVFQTNGDLIVITDSAIPIEEAVHHLLASIEFNLNEFYRLMSIRTKLLTYDEQLYESFDTLSVQLLERKRTPWYRFRRRQQQSSQASKCISLCHIIMVKHERTLLHLARQRQEFKGDLSDDQILGPISNYLIHHSQSDSELPPSIKSSIVHFENELHLASNVAVIIKASLVGAITGSLLTALLKIVS